MLHADLWGHTNLQVQCIPCKQCMLSGPKNAQIQPLTTEWMREAQTESTIINEDVSDVNAFFKHFGRPSE